MIPLLLATQPIQESDRNFLEQIIMGHEKLIKAAIAHYCWNSQNHDDIMQSVCIKLIENVSTLRPLTSTPDVLSAYIRVTVYHCAVDYARKESRRKLRFVSWDDAEQTVTSNGMEQQLEEKELYSVLFRLPERDRILLYCKYIFGMDYREIARMMHIKPKSVWTYLHNARKKALELITERSPASGDSLEKHK